MPVSIPLYRGGETTPCTIALVDDEFAHLAHYSWLRRFVDGRIYAERTKDSVLMHRVILGLARGDGLKVDHINGDGLDNRRANLRLATTAQNAQNQGARRASTSKHRGVSWSKTRQRWVAQATLNGRQHHLGRYHIEEEAAAAAAAFRAEHMPFSREARVA